MPPAVPTANAACAGTKATLVTLAPFCTCNVPRPALPTMIDPPAATSEPTLATVTVPMPYRPIVSAGLSALLLALALALNRAAPPFVTVIVPVPA